MYSQKFSDIRLSSLPRATRRRLLRIFRTGLIKPYTQIVQFPQLQAPIDDTDLDVVGYEFILQKLKDIHDE